MSKVVWGIKFCFTYLDDMLIYSISRKEHLQHLEIIFNHEILVKLKINLANVSFKQHLHYLGHLISKQGIQPLPEKVIAITNLKEPNSMESLCHFLGFTSYHRRFVPLFADITKPLNTLLKKDTKFQWSAQCWSAFEHLKKALCIKSILQCPNIQNCTPYLLT